MKNAGSDFGFGAARIGPGTSGDWWRSSPQGFEIRTDNISAPDGSGGSRNAAIYLPLAVFGVHRGGAAYLKGRQIGRLTVADLEIRKLTPAHEAHPVQQRQMQGIYILRNAGAGATYFCGETNVLDLEAGDLAICDAARAGAVHSDGALQQTVWFVPPDLLPSSVSRENLPLQLRRTHPINAILTSYLNTLLAEEGRMDPADRATLAANVGAMTCIAASSAAGVSRQHYLRAGELLSIQQYIDRHLFNPVLTPSRVAKAMGISARKLHVLFKPSGLSFSEYLMQRRLEEAQARLVTDGESVTAIAYETGFNSLATFYRAYRTQFGCSPGDTRRAAWSKQ